jgi:excisionase family DNA binding protein
MTIMANKRDKREKPKRLEIFDFANLPILKIDEAVVYSCLSRATLYRAIQAGQLRSLKIGKSRRVRRDDLEAFLVGSAQ